MPLDLSAHTLKKNTNRPLTVPLEAYEGDVTVALEYDPAQYNAEVEQMMLEGFETKPATVCRQVLLTFIKSWDLTYGGEPIPVSEEGLKNVRLFEVQVPIVNAIMGDMGELGKSQQPSSRRTSSSAKQRPRK